MRILLTGAGGFVGGLLLARLRHDGFTTRALSRRPASALRLADEVVIETLSPTSDFAALTHGIDTVIHLADSFNAYEHLPVSAMHDEAATRLETTRALARAAATGGVAFIYLSTIKTMCGPYADHVLTEASPARPQSLYGLLKLRAERAILDTAERHRTRAVVLRFPIVFGPGAGGNMERLLRLASLPVPLPFAGLNNRRSLISAAGLINAVAAIVVREDGPGGAFLVHDGIVSTSELFTHVRRGLGRKPNLFALPRSLWTLAERLPKTGALAQRLIRDLALDDACFRAAYGWRPPMPLPESLTSWAARQ